MSAPHLPTHEGNVVAVVRVVRVAVDVREVVVVLVEVLVLVIVVVDVDVDVDVVLVVVEQPIGTVPLLRESRQYVDARSPNTVVRSSAAPMKAPLVVLITCKSPLVITLYSTSLVPNAICP